MFEAHAFFNLGAMQGEYLYGRHLASNRQFQYPPQHQQTPEGWAQGRQDEGLREMIRRQAELAKYPPAPK